MAIAKQKYVQAFVQIMNRVVDLEQQADTIVQEAKTKFLDLGIDLSDTNLTPAQISAISNHINSLNDLATGAVATFVKEKNMPSHGTKLIDDLE